MAICDAIFKFIFRLLKSTIQEISIVPKLI